VGLEGLPFGVGKISLVAPVHARERTSPNYPARFSKQFQKVNSRKFELQEYGDRVALKIKEGRAWHSGEKARAWVRASQRTSPFLSSSSC
jgi:hypothetical protein